MRAPMSKPGKVSLAYRGYLSTRSSILDSGTVKKLQVSGLASPASWNHRRLTTLGVCLHVCCRRPGPRRGPPHKT
jgi:hypothetical protein